jgi:hypothetical protein
MRSNDVRYLSLALFATTTVIGGCVVAVTPLHHQFAINDANTPPPQPEERQHEDKPQGTRYCDMPPGPVHDKRPILPDFTADDAKHPDVLNEKLAAFIKQQDKYIGAHQKAEDDAYDRWRATCHK